MATAKAGECSGAGTAGDGSVFAGKISDDAGLFPMFIYSVVTAESCGVR